jgi:hypothetical protein
MRMPDQTISFSPDQAAELNRALSDLRHNINNHLSLMVVSLELIRRKPDATERMLANLMAQPQKIQDELRAFTTEFEKAFQIARE